MSTNMPRLNSNYFSRRERRKGTRGAKLLCTNSYEDRGRNFDDNNASGYVEEENVVEVVGVVPPSTTIQSLTQIKKISTIIGWT